MGVGIKVLVCGQGYVGLTLAMAAAKAGHNVIGFDTNKNLIENLLNGTTHVPGVTSEEIKMLIKSHNYLPTSEISYSNNCKIIIIAVPTPLSDKGKPDLSNLTNSLEFIARNFKGEALIINESTSYPGTLRNIVKLILDKSELAKFRYAAAPERVDPGNTYWGISNTTRVIAGLDSTATKDAIDFYKTFCKEIYQVSSPEIAEASKIFENTFRQINIALVNELSSIAFKLGFSAHEAILAASTKPFGFMPFFPSIGVGGHCIPVDPIYLSFIAEQFGEVSNFINLANKINISTPKNVAIRIQEVLGGSLTDKRIQVAGISYKQDTADMREAPSINFMNELKGLGAQVTWFDPLVNSFNGELSVPLDSNIDLGLIVTPHKKIDFSIWHRSQTKVFDLSANSQSYGWPKFL